MIKLRKLKGKLRKPLGKAKKAALAARDFFRRQQKNNNARSLAESYSIEYTEEYN